VARGDLGVETSSADVPLMQKDIIRLSGLFGMPDITATQMLQSMIDNPRPTRAEACDVANAVFDGTDAVMLSGETASGKYPVEAVRTMAEIAAKAETRLADFGRGLGTGLREERSVAGATAVAACVAAREVGAKVIACLTRSGRTATLVSQLRPEAAIVALTPSEAAYYRMALPWGVQAVRVPETPAEELSRVAERALRHGGWARPGDVVVLLTGDTVAAGATNTMRLMKIGG